jgi:hypothetical protein
MEVEAHDTVMDKRLNVRLDFASNTGGKVAALEAQRMAVRV